MRFVRFVAGVGVGQSDSRTEQCEVVFETSLLRLCCEAGWLAGWLSGQSKPLNISFEIVLCCVELYSLCVMTLKTENVELTKVYGHLVPLFNTSGWRRTLNAISYTHTHTHTRHATYSAPFPTTPGVGFSEHPISQTASSLSSSLV